MEKSGNRARGSVSWTTSPGKRKRTVCCSGRCALQNFSVPRHSCFFSFVITNGCRVCLSFMFFLDTRLQDNWQETAKAIDTCRSADRYPLQLTKATVDTASKHPSASSSSPFFHSYFIYITVSLKVLFVVTAIPLGNTFPFRVLCTSFYNEYIAPNMMVC
uniref:Uncharacterized protein n=1 Tax=Daphnia magna TaxID=35525 RepID=A0A0P5FLM1_9CRUS